MKVLSILQISSILFSGFSFWLSLRNYKSSKLRVDIMLKCIDYDRVYKPDYENSAFFWCLSKLPPNNEMIFSFKRIKIENWVSPEIIEKLTIKYTSN